MKIISLDVMNVGVILMFVASGYRNGSKSPIVQKGFSGEFADPVPQAVIITAIVIGFSILALSTVIAVMLSEKCGKSLVKDLERMMEE